MSNTLSRCKPLLGTYVDVSLEADLSDDALLDISIEAFVTIERIHNALGFHDPTTELSVLNRLAQANQQQLRPISDDMRNVLQLALQLSQASAGLFDVTVAPTLVSQGSLPNLHQDSIVAAAQSNWQDIELSSEGVRFHAPLLMDFGGIAKGYAVDKAIEGITAGPTGSSINVVINAGGDLYMSHWPQQRAGIRLPHDPSSHYPLEMRAPALATSACYFSEQESVMIHPAKQNAVVGAHSVSVFADSCMVADALTKLAFLNPQDSSVIRQFGGQAILIDQHGQLREL